MAWDPFEEMRRMQEEMQRAFGRLQPSGGRGTQGFSRTPVSDVRETESSVIADIELPGVDKKDINLIVTDDFIEVSVSSKKEKEIREKKRYSYEASSKAFYRKLPLPTEVDADKAKAEYRNGILRVEMPKKAVAKKEKGKRINIE